MFVLVSMVLLYLLAVVSAEINCGVPEAVTNLRAHNTTNTTTLLTWDPPASTACLDHYRLMHCSYWEDSTSQCAFKTVRLPSDATSQVVEGLGPCARNLIELYSVGSGGERYAHVVLRTGSGDAPKVNNLTTSYVRADFLGLSWDLPTGFDQRCYPGFRVCYSAKGESVEKCVNTTALQFSTRSASLLSPCTEYSFSVVTVDGSFAPDAKTSARSSLSVVTAPQMPSVEATAVRNHSAQVSWQKPDTLSTSCASSYRVVNCHYPQTLFPTNCDTVWSVNMTLNDTGVTVPGLDTCSNNHVSVSLVGHNGYSSIRYLVLADPNSEIPVPSDAEVTYARTSELVLYYYKGAQDCVSSYRACWSRGDGAETCRNTSSTFGATFSNLSLEPCANYSLHFTAFGADGKSSKNHSTSFLTGPTGAPNQSVQLTPHSALLTWGVSPSARQCGQLYDVLWRDTLVGSTGGHAQLPVNTTSYNITGLAACTEYRVSFQTLGSGDTESTRNNTEFYTPLGEVGPITEFKFRYITSAMILMDVNFPDNSRDCIDTYVTCWHETGAPKEQEQCGQRITGWNIDLFNACRNVTVAVTATTNDNRTISGSGTLNPGPKKVLDVMLDENPSARTLNVSWTNPPTNGLCAEYVQVKTTRVADGQTTQAKIAGDATSTTLSGLTPCTTYLIEVKPVASFINAPSGYLARITTSCSDAVPLS